MALKKKVVKPLMLDDEDEIEVSSPLNLDDEDDFEEVETTTSDFEETVSLSENENNIVDLNDSDFEDDEEDDEDDFEEEDDDLEDDEFDEDDNFEDDNDKKPKKNINFNLSFLKSKVFLIVSAILFVTIMLLFVFTNKKSDSNINTATNNGSVSVATKFIKEEHNGVVMLLESTKNQIVNIQRIYKEKSDNVVLCETGLVEVQKGQQEVFLECQNNTEQVKDTTSKLIQDNIFYKD